MKLGRRHLIASIVVLALSIAWNVWVFTRPDPKRSGPRPQSVQEAPLLGTPAVSTDAGPVMAVDPSTIPAPPALDLSKDPRWTRNPFSHGSSAPVHTPPAAGMPMATPPPPANPVLGAILYSETRKPSAIIDGRVVGVGDRVQGGVVASIARDVVVIQLTSGERLRLPLQSAGRPPSP